jgi:hypothetical protein
MAGEILLAKGKLTMPRNERSALIQKIETARKSRVLCYVCGDRPGAVAQVSDDAVRAMYDLVRRIGHVPRLDLYLYSRGGAMEVPWRLVCMLRENCDHLGILVPFRAYSAATLIALGCDEILMGAKGELGAIDPAIVTVSRDGGTPVQEDVRVEDVMSYIEFLRDKAAIKDDETIGKHTHTLAEKLGPWVLGSVYRTHKHIRTVALKMLETHKKPMASEEMTTLVAALAEETRSHGHAISRTEAEKLKLPISRPEKAIEDCMWSLLEEYETASLMREPLDPLTVLGDKDEADVKVIFAWLESSDMAWAWRGDVNFRRTRDTAQSYEIKINAQVGLNFIPPAGIDINSIPQALLAEMQQGLMAQMQQQMPQVLAGIPDQVRELVRLQSPQKSLESRTVGKWIDVTAEGI